MCSLSAIQFCCSANLSALVDVTILRAMSSSECPWCRQPIKDLSNDPQFVNHNPLKQVNFIKVKESKDSKKKETPPDRRCTECDRWIAWSDHWCPSCGAAQ